MKPCWTHVTCLKQFMDITSVSYNKRTAKSIPCKLRLMGQVSERRNLIHIYSINPHQAGSKKKKKKTAHSKKFESFNSLCN